jgi:3-oxoacyl-[acyl-carrier protein] reductase
VADLRAEGINALALGGDVSRPEEADRVVKAAGEALGDIDVLVCSAFGPTDGLIGGHRPGASTLDHTAIDGVLRRVEVQLAATLHTCRAALPGMRRRHGGSIVLIGAAGSRGGANAGPAEIVVAKAAQDALARALAEELGPERIRVNVVAPGMVPTDANAGERQAFITSMLGKATPLGRVAEVEDVADAVVAFAADLTRHVTGAYVSVDGGRSLL